MCNPFFCFKCFYNQTQLQLGKLVQVFHFPVVVSQALRDKNGNQQPLGKHTFSFILEALKTNQIIELFLNVEDSSRINYQEMLCENTGDY